MSSLGTQILTMLEGSSIPGLYKMIFKNMLPDMTRGKQEELFLILATESSKKTTLKTKMKKAYWKYNSILDKLEDDPTFFDKEFFGKGGITKVPTGSTKDLSALKNKMALQNLKNKLDK
jgi:hypothetical protein